MKRPKATEATKAQSGQTQSSREDLRAEYLQARWSSPRQADPVKLLRHVAITLNEKAKWCEERAASAFDCIDDRDDAETTMLDWLTLAGELHATEDLIRSQIDE